MLDKVKKALRITTNAFDDEITGLIDAAKADLYRVGIVVPKQEENTAAEGEDSPDAAASLDPLIERAIILYAKWNFGYNETSEKFRQAYEHLLCALSLGGDYNGGK